MKKIIKESDLRRIIKGVVTEALKYNKDKRQYFPDYTGDAHSDTGSYADNYGDDYNYTRNDYKWSDPKAQQRFQDKQWQNDLDIDPMDPDREGEANAENYRDSRDSYNLVNRASDAMRGDFENMLQQLCDNAAQKFPILKNPQYMSDFIYSLRDALDEFEY